MAVAAGIAVAVVLAVVGAAGLSLVKADTGAPSTVAAATASYWATAEQSPPGRECRCSLHLQD